MTKRLTRADGWVRIRREFWREGMLRGFEAIRRYLKGERR